MIQIDRVAGNIYGDKVEIKIFIYDSCHILNLDWYTNKFDEEVFKVECNNDIIKLCNPNPCEFQKYIMLLLERNIS